MMAKSTRRSKQGGRAVGWVAVPMDVPEPLAKAYRKLRSEPTTKRNSSRTHSAAAISLYMALPPNVREAIRDFVLKRDGDPFTFEWDDALNVMIDTYLGDESEDGRVLHIGNTTYRIERVAS